MSKGRVFAVGVVAILACSAIAVAAPKNGGFEAGAFKNWKTQGGSENGRWFVYERGDRPSDLLSVPPRGGMVDEDGTLPKPPQGKHAAVVVQNGPGSRLLHRNLRLKENRTISLSMKIFYKNFAESFETPRTLDHTSEPNQQFRVDILKPGSPIDTMKRGRILATVFRTKVGDKLRHPKWFEVSQNLTKFAGQTVILRLVEVDNQFFFYTGVDDVKLTQRSRPGADQGSEPCRCRAPSDHKRSAAGRSRASAPDPGSTYGSAQRP